MTNATIILTTDECPEVNLDNGYVTLKLEGKSSTSILSIPYEIAVELADAINHTCMNKTKEEWEEREEELKARIGELEEEVEVKIETLEIIKSKQNNYVPF